jgi:hypothetical protein
MLTPIAAVSPAQARWTEEPTPAEPYCIFAWFAFAWAMNSCRFFAGKSLRATNTIGLSAISATGAKSVTAL